MFESNSEDWANSIFGDARLGDPRRTKRLVKLASDMANGAGKSIVKASGDSASIEGAYRFVRNDNISAREIAQSGFNYTSELAQERRLVLAIEDTTGLSYTHSICNELGNVHCSSRQTSKGRTLFQHSCLVLDADDEQVLGLAHQQSFYRKERVRGTKYDIQRRPKEEKESYRWQQTSEELDKTLKRTDNILHVCDREADSFEYFEQHIESNRRFIVRSSYNRKLSFPTARLHELREEPVIDEYDLQIMQKGGRKQRVARVGISYHKIIFPKPKKAVGGKELKLNVVICQELNNPNESSRLCWYLFTNETINGKEEARKIVRYYELRWKIEEFHKVWKTDGTQVEKLRLQHRENIERMSIILAFVAVRLMQLKEVEKESNKHQSCESFFSPVEWKIMWRKTESKPFPKIPPTLHWAYYAIAKLGRWHDSKRTGVVGVKALWDGWATLMIMIDSYRMLKGLDLDDDL